ncbi:MAG: hypothetical protein MI892_27010 [Desulfobacterales bacterium]|nr:hypothetical protein [Desulfobacterales bacterium]
MVSVQKQLNKINYEIQKELAKCQPDAVDSKNSKPSVFVTNRLIALHAAAQLLEATSKCNAIHVLAQYRMIAIKEQNHPFIEGYTTAIHIIQDETYH